MTLPELDDKVVLITGAANGIGAAIARAFAAQGARVRLCDVDRANGTALARSLGGRAAFRAVDLRREKAVTAWIEGVAQKDGAIHCLINNAAADPRIPLSKMTCAQWDDLFARNLRSFFIAARAAESRMPQDGTASIINFSSITFHQGPPEMTAYVATKAGIQGFTRSLARELGPKRIRVNTLSPGWIMTDRQLEQFVTPAVKRMLRKEQCIPDLIQPEEVADVALFLASAASRAVTGQEILVDRGWRHS